MAQTASSSQASGEDSTVSRWCTEHTQRHTDTDSLTCKQCEAQHVTQPPSPANAAYVTVSFLNISAPALASVCVFARLLIPHGVEHLLLGETLFTRRDPLPSDITERSTTRLSRWALENNTRGAQTKPPLGCGRALEKRTHKTQCEYRHVRK